MAGAGLVNTMSHFDSVIVSQSNPGDYLRGIIMSAYISGGNQHIVSHKVTKSILLLYIVAVSFDTSKE